jgi:hypothetical protein
MPKEIQSIYLLRTREFIALKQNVYKIGKTKQDGVKRIQNYPKGTQLHLMIEVTNCDVSEKVLLDLFRKKYKPRTEFGAEYFEGDLQQMKWDIIHNCAGTPSSPPPCSSLVCPCTIL